MLARLADSALAVHGQNDQLRLLRPAEQRALLDRFAGDTGRTAAAVPAVRSEWQAVAAELVERRDGARRLAQEADLLRHGLTEIEAVDPQPGEDRELTEEARRLAAADDLREAAGTARAAIAGGDAMDDAAPAAVALVGEARHRLAASGDGALAALDTVLGDVLAQLDDVAGELTIYLDRLDADPERLAHVLGRQAELKALIRKYAADIDGVLAWAQQARKRLEHLDTSDDALAALAVRRDALAAELAGPRRHRHQGTHRCGGAAGRPHHRRAGRAGHAGRPAAGRRHTPSSGPGSSRRAGPSTTRPSPRARTASTTSSCGWSPTPAPRRNRCTRERRAGSCRA